MSNIIVFGGTGRTGREVVRQALSLGHSVSVFSYTLLAKDKLPSHKRLHIITGDAKVYHDVDRAIRGHDVVINIIAPKMFDKKNYPISELATNNIINAMQKHGVQRYIGQSGAWATEHLHDASPLMQLSFKVFLPLRNIYHYKKKEDTIVKNSNLNWTLVRCGLLTNKQPSSPYRIYKKRYTCGVLEVPSIRRVNVAQFELKIIDDRSYYQECPIIIE